VATVIHFKESTMGFWFLLALAVWWSVATLGCGETSCLPFIMFIYAPYTWPVVIYLACAYAFGSRLPSRWRLGGFLLLAIFGFAGLIAIARSRQPLLFVDWVASAPSLRLILYPALGAAAVYLARMLLSRARSSHER
jgi:hypothetical protein